MRETNQMKYFRFTDDWRYSKDLYEIEKKFKPNIKRSKSEKTLKHRYKLDFRSTFLYLPTWKNLLKEVKIIEEEELKIKNKELPEGYEYKNLK